MAIVIKRPGGIKLLLQASNAAPYPPPTVDPLNVEYFYRYKDDNHGPQYIGTFPVGKPVQIPLATDLDRDIVVTTRSRGPIGQQQINDIRDAPSLTIQSEREQRQPVIGQMGASTYLKAIIGVSYFPRHMKTRRILVATDEEFEDIVAEWYQDIDREEAETPRLSEQFSIQRLSPTSGTATYYIKVAHASFSTAIAKEATYQEKLEGLRWGPDSEVLEITLADNNGNGGSSGAFNPFTATFQGYGSGASGLLFSVPMPGDNSGGVTGTSNGFADQVALWEADDTLSFRLGIQADRPRGMLKANGFTGTVGAINAKVDYRASGSSTATTGNMSSGSNVLIVPSSTDFFVDQGITVAGAGPSGATLYSTVQSISTDGLTITLNHSASSPVTGATVNHDDTAAIQAAIDAATSVGRAIHIPAGIYRVRTLQLLDYYWHLYGEGPGRSVLQAAEANQPVIEITNQQAHTITIENLAIVGAGVSSGSSGHGIYVHDNDFDAFNIVLRNLRVADCGGRGVYLAQHFTTLLERVDVRNCGGNAIELQGNNTCRLANCYVADVPAGKAGYRIYNGHPLFESCNGVDSAGSWGVFGKSAAEDGADNFCFPVFLNCNVEGWGLGANAVDGIRIKNGFGHFLSTTWFAGATGTNLRALRQDFVDANWNSIIDAACQFYAPNGATQWANSQPVHSNGAPFIQFGALLTQYYDMGASAVRTLPTIKSNLIAGSSNVATWLSRAKIEALEASNLVGDLTGGVDFGGNVARVLLKAGTAGRPPLANVDDDDTGVYWGTNEIGLTINGSGKYSFHQNYFRVDAPIGVNTFPSAGYSFHSVNGGALVVAASGATIPTLELRGGVNTHLFVNDTSASIQARLGTLAGAPDRAFVGTMTNHPFGVYVNGAEAWTFSSAGHLAPQGSYDVGTASLPIRDLNLSRNVVFPSGVRQSFAPNATNAGVNVGTLAGDPSGAQNGDYWYNSTTGKQRTRENGTNKDVIQASSGNITGSLVSGRVVLSNGAAAITDSANLTYDLTSFINQRAGGNPNFQAIDTTNSITARLGTLAGAPDRAFVGTVTNHPFGFYQNNSERWTINTSGHFVPGSPTTYSLGSASLPLNDVVVGGSGVFVERTAPGTPSANTVALYAKDKAGVSALYLKNDAGTETELGATGANTALSNIASVAIPVSLISDTDNADDLGSSSINWRDGFFGRDLTVKRRLIGGGSVPSSSTGTGAGTSPSIVVDGSQLGCFVSLTTGSSPATNAKIFDLTLSVAAPNYYIATLTPVNVAAKTLSGNQQVFISDADATSSKITIKSGSTGLAGSTTYDWYVTFIAV